MDESKTLPWLEKLAAHIPAYGGYRQTAGRRHADRAFRDVIARRLSVAEAQLGAAIQECLDRNAERQVGTLEVFRQEVQRLARRVRHAGSPEGFFEAGEFDSAKADSLHALDHALLDRADALVELTRKQPEGGDWLAHLRDQIEQFERKLDARALLFQHLT